MLGNAPVLFPFPPVTITGLNYIIEQEGTAECAVVHDPSQPRAAQANLEIHDRAAFRTVRCQAHCMSTLVVRVIFDRSKCHGLRYGMLSALPQTTRLAVIACIV